MRLVPHDRVWDRIVAFVETLPMIEVTGRPQCVGKEPLVSRVWAAAWGRQRSPKEVGRDVFDGRPE